jgi:hypothetical protein
MERAGFTNGRADVAVVGAGIAGLVANVETKTSLGYWSTMVPARGLPAKSSPLEDRRAKGEQEMRSPCLVEE